jgi:hypothetical protein
MIRAATGEVEMSELMWPGVKVIAVMAVLLVAGCTGVGAEPGLQETTVVIETSPAPAATAEPAPSTEPTAMAFPQDSGQVEVVVSKEVYGVGEVISYTIVNHSDTPIYYRYTGCGHPYIVQWVGDEEVVLAINILDVEPYLENIEPGGSVACTWDQTFHYTAGSDSDVQGHRYQVRFWYAFTEEEVNVPGGQLMAVSQVFTIE